MTDELKNRIHTLYGLYATGMNRIAGWNERVPDMQQTLQNLAWMDDTISRAPTGLNVFTSERLLDYVDKATLAAGVLGQIPDPRVMPVSIWTASGSAVSSEYYQFVNDAADHLRADPEVTAWAGVTITLGDELLINQNRSEKVRQRLDKLNPDLGQLYQDAIDSTLAAKAGTQTPIESAAVLDRVIERFKGELIGRCRRSTKATYQNISGNFAADSPLTKTVVSDGQTVYDNINTELMKIRKSMQPATGEQMMQLLRRIEDHVVVITDALDPSKIGITF